MGRILAQQNGVAWVRGARERTPWQVGGGERKLVWCRIEWARGSRRGGRRCATVCTPQPGGNAQVALAKKFIVPGGLGRQLWWAKLWP